MALRKALLGKRLIAATRLARWEHDLARAAQRALDRQRDHALAAARTMHTRAVVASVPPDAFDLDGWGDDVGNEVETAAQGILAEIRTTMAAKFLIRPGALPEIDITTRLDRMLGLMQGLGPTTSEAIGQTLTQGVFQGESIPSLAARVQAVFDVADRRAETIARTEVVGASNSLSLDYASAVNGADGAPDLQKTWLATNDDRTRPAHIDADGQTVGVDEPFDVDGEDLMYPGDEDGSPENVVNCRCTPIYDEVGTEYGDDLHLDSTA